MEELVQLVFKTYGIVGLLILAPVVACGVLWRENKSLSRIALESVTKQSTEAMKSIGEQAEKMTKAYDTMGKVQEKRVQDSQLFTDKLVSVVSEQSSLNRETLVAVESLSRDIQHIKTSTGRD